VLLTDSYSQAQLALVTCFAWLWLRNKDISKGSVFALLTCHIVLIALIDWQISYISPLTFWLYNLSLFSSGLYLSFKRFIKGDALNKKTICFGFYKPKNLKQTIISLPSQPVSSFAMFLGDKGYQLKKNAKTMQEIKFNSEEIKHKYIIIDTGCPISKVTKSDIKLLLKQKARQPQTLWLRLNCLRSFKPILNKLEGYEYEGELLPTWYLNKIMRGRK